MKITHQITILATLLLFTVSCASVSNRAEIPHPPTYKDFIKLQSSDYEEMSEDFFLRRIDLMMCISSCDKADEIINDKKAAEIKQECIKNKSDERILEELDKNLKFKKAIQFTPKEMNIIRQSKNLRAVVGAGIQSGLDENLGTELLESASASEASPGFVLVSLIDRYFALQPKGTTDSSLSEKLQASIVKLLQIDPGNALSYYLAAYKQHMIGNDNEALSQLKEGNTIEKFTSYSTERFFAVVEAAESIGYPKFTARQHAMNSFDQGEINFKLIDLCKSLIKIEEAQDARKECLRMGEKIEARNNNAFEKIQGLILQSAALRELSNPKDVEHRVQISKKQKDISETGSRLVKIPFRDIPEGVWLQYFEIFFYQSEQAAIEFMEDYHKATQQDGK